VAAVPPSALSLPLPLLPPAPAPTPALVTVVRPTWGLFLDPRTPMSRRTVPSVTVCRWRLSSARLSSRWRSRFVHVARHFRSSTSSSILLYLQPLASIPDVLSSSSPLLPIRVLHTPSAHVAHSSHHPRCMRRPHPLVFPCTYISGQIPRIHRCTLCVPCSGSLSDFFLCLCSGFCTVSSTYIPHV